MIRITFKDKIRRRTVDTTPFDINLLDKYESNHTGDGQTDRQKNNGGTYRKDVKICKIGCNEPYCHGTLDINDSSKTGQVRSSFARSVFSKCEKTRTNRF